MTVIDLAMIDLGSELAAPVCPYEPGDSMRALLARACSWTHSLAKLDAPFHVAAHAAGGRALLETLVDLKLLQKKPLEVRRMLAFEGMQRVLAGEETLAAPASIEIQAQMAAFMREHAKTIRAEAAAAGLGSGKEHRWTGKALRVDAVDAGADVAHFSDSLMRLLNWGVHGSANTLFRAFSTPEVVSELAATMLFFARRAAFSCAVIVADEFERGAFFRERLAHYDRELKVPAP